MRFAICLKTYMRIIRVSLVERSRNALQPLSALRPNARMADFMLEWRTPDRNVDLKRSCRSGYDRQCKVFCSSANAHMAMQKLMIAGSGYSRSNCR